MLPISALQIATIFSAWKTWKLRDNKISNETNKNQVNMIHCIVKTKMSEYLQFQIRLFPLHHICYRSAAHKTKQKQKDHVIEAINQQNQTHKIDIRKTKKKKKMKL